MKPLLTYLLLALTTGEISLELLALIAKAKTERTPAVFVEPKVETPKADSAKVNWQSYSEAHKAYLENKQPLFVMIGAEWCAPCKSLKAAIEKANIAGINYAYIDVDKDPRNVAALGFSGQFTIPHARIYSMLATKSLDTSSHDKVLSGITQYAHMGMADVSREYAKAKATQAKASYSWRIERIATPQGFSVAYVDRGTSYYTHVVRDHGDALREVLSRVSIRHMRERDLFALHSLLHKGMPVGRWDGNCFVFQLPDAGDP